MTQGYKFTVIGGGSSYTPELVQGLIARKEALPLRELVLVDVPEGREKVETIAALSRRMLEKAGLGSGTGRGGYASGGSGAGHGAGSGGRAGSGATVRVEFDRRRAIEGADFVVSQFRVGGLQARARDEHIPLRYDVIGQETTGPGGFAKALRTIPVALGVAKDILELAPDAWLMNFTNPAGIVTEAITKHAPGVKVIGLCNVPISIQRTICKFMDVEPWRVEIDLVGLNHLGWIRAIRFDGQDILPNVLSLPVVEEQFVQNIPGAKTAALRPLLSALGMLPSPYLQYYYFRQELLAEEKERIASGKGSRADEVMAVEKELFAKYRDPDLAEKPPELSKRGGAYYSEAALDVMVSLVGKAGGPADGPRNRHIVNVVNRRAGSAPGRQAAGAPARTATDRGSAAGRAGAAAGAGGATGAAASGDPAGDLVLPDLPPDVVVETPCLVGPGGAYPVGGGPLPLSIRGLVEQVKAYEELTVEAAVTGSRDKAFLALVNHPLVPGAEVARALLEDILEANKDYLPTFGG